MNARDFGSWTSAVALRRRVASPVSHIGIETSTMCGLNCIMCRLDERTRLSKNRLLPFVDAVEIYDAIRAPRITLSHSGEPFLNPDILKIIGYVHDQGSWTSVTSSLDTIPGTPRDLVTCGLDMLKVSLDAARPETYASIREGSDFDRVLANTRAVLRERTALGSSTPLLRLGFVIMEQNYRELDEFVLLAADLGITVIRFYTLKPMAQDILPISFDLPVLREKMWKAKEVALRKGIRTNIDSIPTEAFVAYGELGAGDYRSFPSIYKRAAHRERLESKCLQPWLASNVLMDGTVSPCYVLAPPDETRMDVGNISRQSWDSIWNGEQYADFRDSVRHGGCTSCIQRCVGPRTLSHLFVLLRDALPSIR